MVAIATPGLARPLHPFHAILLAFPLPLFLGALLSDLAYGANYHQQWANFASWLIAGGLLMGGLALLWAVVELFLLPRPLRRWHGFYILALLVMWGVGFINALIHANDAWASMPEGLWLSIATVLLALLASWMGYSRFERGDVR